MGAGDDRAGSAARGAGGSPAAGPTSLSPWSEGPARCSLSSRDSLGDAYPGEGTLRGRKQPAGYRHRRARTSTQTASRPPRTACPSWRPWPGSLASRTATARNAPRRAPDRGHATPGQGTASPRRRSPYSVLTRRSLAEADAVQLGLAHCAVRPVPRRGVHRSATGVALLGEQKRLGVPSGPQDVVGGVQQCAADAPPRRAPGGRTTETSPLLRYARRRSRSRHAQRRSRRAARPEERVVGDQLIPVPCREHRWLRDVAREASRSPAPRRRRPLQSPGHPQRTRGAL